MCNSKRITMLNQCYKENREENVKVTEGGRPILSEVSLQK